MRKGFALLTALALPILCSSAAAESSKALPQPGEKMHGFTVAAVHPYESMGAQAVEFTHDKTGATLLWIANSSTDRSFAVGFRTHVTNDKGIPHVFEHATISGSEKYPNPNLFMTALYGTYNTYMNAGTATTYTMYPSSSLSEDQLLKYVDFYMNGVYHPLVVEDERLMHREAYRYDLPSADAELTLQGTVYSEMLGGLTQFRTALDNARRATFPGSVYASETGGVPGVIETMTHQDLIDFHDTYYHPSNSLMVLYGDVNVERFLELIDGEYLSAYDRKEIDLSDAGYTPISGDVEMDVAFPVGKDDAADTIMIYTVPLEGMTLTEFRQFTIAASAMMQNGQPFTTLIQQKLPGVSVSRNLDTEGPCPSIGFVVMGAKPEQKDEVRDVIREGIAVTLEQGLDPDLLSSAVLAERMSQAQLADNVKAVNAVQEIISYWGMKGDPLAFLEVDAFAQNMQADLEAGAFDAVLKKYLAAPAATSLVVSTGEPGLKEKQDEELKQRLAEMKAAMSEEEIAELVAQHDDLEQWNAENEATVSVEPLRAVDVQTLPEEIVAYTAKDETADGLRVVSSEVDSDLVKIDLYFDASGVPADRLDEAMMGVDMIGMLSTEQYDAAALRGKIGTLTSGVSTEMTSVRRDDSSYTPYAHVSFSCFTESVGEMFDLIEEMLLHTKYDPQEMQPLCAFYAPAQKNNLDPLQYSIELASSAFSESAAYESRMNGSHLARSMARVAAMSAEEMAEFAQGAEETAHALFNRNGMILTVAGSAENIAAVTERTQQLRAKFTDEEIVPVDYSEALASPKNVAATYGSDAMYTVVALPTKELGVPYSGKLRAFSSAVGSTVLIPVLRNAYSVYSPQMAISREMTDLILYRDPRLKESFTEVIPTLGQSVRDLALTQEELDGYITNAYSNLAAPVGPFTGAAAAIEDALKGRNSFERKLTEMKELKQTTPEDIAAYADILDKLATDGARITVGSPTLIEEAKDLFDEVQTWLTE